MLKESGKVYCFGADDMGQVHDACGGRFLWSRGLRAEDERPSSADGRGTDVQRFEGCGGVENVSLTAFFVADSAQ